MPVRIEHHDGPIDTLEVATYTVRTATGRPMLRCPACGGFFEILTPIELDGTATITCPWSCSFFDEVLLDAWEPPHVE